MSEWFKELVLKTSDSERDRGFESHLLRQNNKEPLGSLLFFAWRSGMRTREGARVRWTLAGRAWRVKGEAVQPG